MANMESTVNTWLEKSKHKIDNHDKFLLACGKAGLFPFDFTTIEQIKTLSIVAKHFLVAY